MPCFRRWWSAQVCEFVQHFFGYTHADLINHFRWQVDTLALWISPWMDHINALCQEEWNRLDVDLQRLYVLLDYASENGGGDSIAPSGWMHILKHPKYCSWVAKVLLFNMDAAAASPPPVVMPAEWCPHIGDPPPI